MLSFLGPPEPLCSHLGSMICRRQFRPPSDWPLGLGHLPQAEWTTTWVSLAVPLPPAEDGSGETRASERPRGL